SGNDFIVARTFRQVDRAFERKLKKTKNISRYCPLCNKSFRPYKDYIEPTPSIPRAYKTIKLSFYTLIENITISHSELMTRLSKRIKVGEKVLINDSIYLRRNKSKFGQFWELQDIEF
ncbi:MAG: hypothetical protein WBP82_01010, partial [Leuconostoc mesenteroides]